MAFLFTGTRLRETPPTGVVRSSAWIELSSSGWKRWIERVSSSGSEMDWEGGPRRRAGAAGAPPRGRWPATIRSPGCGASGSVRGHRAAGLTTARRIGARGRVRRRARVSRWAARAPGRLPVVMLTCIRTADSNRKAGRPLSSERISSPSSTEGGNRTLDRVIISHVLYPTELLRWSNEPRAPNDTRRAMVSLGTPDRHPEPEPLFEPRCSRYALDGHAPCGGRRGSSGASVTRRFKPGGASEWRGASRGLGAPRASIPVRPGAAGRSKVIRAVKERSGCMSTRGRGNKKAPVGLHAGRGFRFRETCGGCFLHGPPDRCPGRPTSWTHHLWAAHRRTATACLRGRGRTPAPSRGAAGVLRSSRWAMFSTSSYPRSRPAAVRLPARAAQSTHRHQDVKAPREPLGDGLRPRSS